MSKSKTLKVKVERVISAPPKKVFEIWMNPKSPGNPWYEGSRLLFNPKVDGFFYWYVSGTPHYGRFTKIKKGSLVQHTWMSPYTQGQETNVTVTFKKKGADTLMTLVHAGLPNNSDGRGHNDGWNYFMDWVVKHFKRKMK